MESSKKAPNDNWWRGGVIYQIYPRSYADSNGDGIGDLPGITARLEHIAHLGADARLATRDAALHALARHANAAGGWLGIDAVEQLFSRLAARAAGRPAAQDALPVDGASAARLVILRELLHHGALSGLQLID